MRASSATAVLLPLAVALITLACFIPCLNNGFVAWDDIGTILHNPNYRGLSAENLTWMFTTYRGGHYQPLSWITFAVDYELWGMNPTGYHLTSVLVHSANAALFYFVILALFRRASDAVDARALRRRRLAAAAGALFFAVHPLRVESVAWATERRDVLSGLFLLIAVLCYLAMRQRQAAGVAWRGSHRASLVAYLASLLSKAWGMTLPVVLVILDWLVPIRTRQRRRVAWAAARDVAPYLVFAAVFAALALAAQSATPAVATHKHGLAARALQAGYGTCFYVWKTLVPTGLSPLYPIEHKLVSPGWIYYGSTALAIVVTILAVWGRKRWPAVGAAWLSYIVVVSPVLGFAQSGVQLVADRYSYVACLPWAVLLAALLVRLVSRARSRLVEPVLWTLAALVLAVLAILTVRQEAVWKNSLTLWDQAVVVEPDSGVIRFFRGNSRFDAGDIDGAIDDFTRAIELDARGAVGTSYLHRGVARYRKGDGPGAAEDFRTAGRLNDRLSPETFLSQGVEAVERRDWRTAVQEMDKALLWDPRILEAYIHRARILEALGDLPRAARDYEAALALVGSSDPELQRRLRGELQRLRGGSGGR